MAAIEGTREDLYAKYNVSSSSGSGSETTSRYESNERSYSSGTEAANSLFKEGKDSGLFNRRIKDGAGAINDFIKNDLWKVDMDINGDGIVEDGVNIADAVALSCDSELDLYIIEEVENIFEKYNCYSLKELFGKQDADALKDLARLGIRADAVGDDAAWQNRTYAFSLVKLPSNAASMSDEDLLAYVYGDDAEILTDKNGKKGSFIFADGLVADGMAQGAEINMSSILDTMGYECISKADFVDRQEDYFDLLAKIKEDIGNGEYETDGNINDLYSEKRIAIDQAVRAVHNGIGGHAYGVKGWSTSDKYTKTYEEIVDLIATKGLGSMGGNAVEGGHGTSNSDSSSVDAENKKEMEAEEKEQTQTEKEKEEFRSTYISNAIENYKDKNNGEEPTGAALVNIETEADIAAKAKFGI